jgi:hypothetical protein
MSNTVRCSICKAGISVARYVDASADLSAAALSRQAAAVGMDLSTDRIATHRKHRAEEEPARIAKNGKDFAVLMRDRIADAVEQLKPEEREDGSQGLDPILMKDLQPAINSGLKAQAILDSREKAAAKKGNAELAFAIIAMLTGHGGPVPALEDGMTIEGTAVEVDDEAD